MNFEPSSNSPILAIDLGKFNSMCCFFDPGSQESRFQTVPTNRGYLRSFSFRPDGGFGGLRGLRSQRLAARSMPGTGAGHPHPTKIACRVQFQVR